MQKVDVVIIGAGPAGTVAASYLHNNGHRVLVLEKEKFPRFQIGESLLPCCMEHLDEVGLLDAIIPLNFQKKTGAAFMNGEERCEFFFSEQYTKGWTWTWQVKRAEFDMALAEGTMKKGVPILFEHTVLEVKCSPKDQIVTYQNKEGESYSTECKFIIDASGYGRVLPRLFNLNKPSSFTARGAIFTHVVDSLRNETESNNIFVHAFDNNASWLWAIPFSDGTTSIGIVGNDDTIHSYSCNEGQEFKSFIKTFPDLKERFQDAKLLFEPRSILGYSIGIEKMWGDGFVLCGNSTEFLDPIFSSGVTFATSSGLLAAKLTRQQLNGIQVDWQNDYEAVVKNGIEVFRSYVAAWYSGEFQTILFTHEIDPEIKKKICSVLAGYVWDQTNPFVKKHKTILPTLAKVIKIREQSAGDQ